MNQSKTSSYYGRRFEFSLPAFLFASVIGAVLLIFFESTMSYRAEQVQKSESAKTISFSNELIPNLEKEINKLIYLSSGIQAYIKVYSDELDEDKMLRILAETYQESEFIQHLAISEGSVVKYISPLEGNEKALGLDYRNVPDQWEEIQQIIAAKTGMMAGPVNLVQGGRALIYRVPVYVRGEFWGIISSVVNIEKFFHASLSKLDDHGVEIAIRLKTDSTANTLYGNPLLFDNSGVTKLDSKFINLTWEYALQGQQEGGSMAFVNTLLWVGRGSWLVLYLILIFAFQVSYNNQQNIKKYEILAKNITDVIWVYNLTLERFEYVSPSRESYSGLNPEILKKIKIGDTLTSESKKIVEESIKKALSTFEKGETKSNRLELQQYTSNGNVVWIEVVTKLTRNPKGEIEVLGISRDIDEKKKAELDLLKNKAQLQSLNSTKDSFFSIIGHDLKSPLSSMKGTLDFLIANYSILKDADREKFLCMSRDTAEHAFKLLENLLAWARAQSGDLCFSPESLLIFKLVNDEIKLLEGTANNKFIHIDQDVPGDLEIEADAFMVSSVIRNLISNALKFTPQGGTIHVGAFETNGRLTLNVADTGVGIDAAVIPDLFKIDKKTTTQGTANEKGTGLGLVLCQEFIKRHQGEIHVESKQGEGSTFSFTIPTHQPSSLPKDKMVEMS